jgi:hypothetical protein
MVPILLISTYLQVTV